MPILKQLVKIAAIRIHLPRGIARRAVAIEAQHFAIGRPAQPEDEETLWQRRQFPLLSRIADGQQLVAVGEQAVSVWHPRGIATRRFNKSSRGTTQNRHNPHRLYRL